MEGRGTFGVQTDGTRRRGSEARLGAPNPTYSFPGAGSQGREACHVTHSGRSPLGSCQAEVDVQTWDPRRRLHIRERRGERKWRWSGRSPWVDLLGVEREWCLPDSVQYPPWVSRFDRYALGVALWSPQHAVPRFCPMLRVGFIRAHRRPHPSRSDLPVSLFSSSLAADCCHLLGRSYSPDCH